MVAPWLRFHIPLIEPASQLSRTRLPLTASFFAYTLPPLPRCRGWAWSSLISPNRVSLPRKGRRGGLHIVLFEMLWGGGEEIVSIVADMTDGDPNAKAERPEPIPYRPET